MGWKTLSLDIIQGFVHNWCSSWQVGCSCCNAHHGWLVIITTANCISLFLCLNSMKYHQSGLEINTIHPANCGHNLTVESNYVFSIWHLSFLHSWMFLNELQGSPVWGVLLVWPVLSHSFLLCLVSFYKPTTCTVFQSLRELLKSPFFPVVQYDTMWDRETQTAPICSFLYDI